MRTGLWLAVVILVVVLAGSTACGTWIDQVSQVCVSTGQELEVLCLEGGWQQAEAVLNEAWLAWCEKLPWLCAVIDHADAELVTAALTEVRAAVRVKDVSRAVSGCYAVMAAADAMKEHERLSFENVL